nr:MAG: replication initiator protein [Microviridae sp.]
MECLSPMSVPRPNGAGNTDRITVPCGKCVSCLMKKRNQWSFRLKQELKVSKTALFVTLTYSDENLPENQSLSKRDCQLFLKRLRRLTEKYEGCINRHGDMSLDGLKWPKLRYFLVGEYGSETKRPHYHMILFNLPTWPDAKFMLETAWTKPETNIIYGHVHIGSVTPASISYTAKYCITTLSEMKGKEGNFSLMSTRPGIGISYVKKMAKYHQDLQNFFGIDQGGVKVSLPRYYRDKIFIDYEKRKANILATLERDKLPYLGGENELQSKRQFGEKVKKTITKSNKL